MHECQLLLSNISLFLFIELSSLLQPDQVLLLIDLVADGAVLVVVVEFALLLSHSLMEVMVASHYHVLWKLAEALA